MIFLRTPLSLIEVDDSEVLTLYVFGGKREQYTFERYVTVVRRMSFKNIRVSRKSINVQVRLIVTDFKIALIGWLTK